MSDKRIDEALLKSVEAYIKEKFVSPWESVKTLAMELPSEKSAPPPEPKETKEPKIKQKPEPKEELDELMLKMDSSFSEYLMYLIDKSGMKDSQVYKKARIDRKLFSKIRSNREYNPSKTTAIAFALALELDLDEAESLFGRAGFTLSHSSKFDIIIEYFIRNEIYDISEINEVLYAFDQPLLG